MVTLDTDEAWQEPGVFSNVPIACFVTAWARMKLNRVLQKLQFRALYFDTGRKERVFDYTFLDTHSLQTALYSFIPIRRRFVPAFFSAN